MSTMGFPILIRWHLYIAMAFSAIHCQRRNPLVDKNHDFNEAVAAHNWHGLCKYMYIISYKIYIKFYWALYYWPYHQFVKSMYSNSSTLCHHMYSIVVRARQTCPASLKDNQDLRKKGWVIEIIVRVHQKLSDEAMDGPNGFYLWLGKIPGVEENFLV